MKRTGTLTIEPNQAKPYRNERQIRSCGRLIVYGNPEKSGLPPVLREVARWAAAQHLTLSVASEIAHALEPPPPPFVAPSWQVYKEESLAGLALEPGERALLVCLGGDGTLIRAVHRFWPLPAPVLSVNLGSLGFNASVEPEAVTKALDDWLHDRSQVSQRMAIRVSLLRGEEVLTQSMAVNDVVLAKHFEARLIHFNLRQGDNLLSSFAADGLIVATPTGSTAYNLSAGGPIVYPTLQAMIATAICPHTLAFRPMILPPAPALMLEFALRNKRDQALLWIDGQEHWPLLQGDRIAVEADPAPLRLIANGAAHYFATLRRKLCWSGKPIRTDAVADEE